MKLIKILIISIFIIVILSQNVFAIGEILSTSTNWMVDGKDHAGIGIDTANLQTKANDLYNLLLAVATVVAVIVGAILGIKYMLAGIEEKVQVKESLFPYLISCMVVFGSIGIWKLVVAISKNLL